MPSNAEFLAHISFADGKGDFFACARYNGERLTSAQTERLRSCTLGDLEMVWPLLQAGVKALRQAESEQIQEVRYPASTCGVKVRKFNRGLYPGRYDIVRSGTGVLASGLDVAQVQEWIRAEAEQQEERKRRFQERYPGLDPDDPFSRMFVEMREMFERHGDLFDPTPDTKLFEVLGVDRHATPEEVRSAYRKLAKQYHPDVNIDPDAPRRFKEITAAYKELSRGLA